MTFSSSWTRKPTAKAESAGTTASVLVGIPDVGGKIVSGGFTYDGRAPTTKKPLKPKRFWI